MSTQHIETPEGELDILRQRLYVLRRICRLARGRAITAGQPPILEGYDRGYRAAMDQVLKILDSSLRSAEQEARHA